ncbi:DUF3291 domain-containing protein [Agarivorans sp. 1_MG-2023]|uniref:DUF3291 domain-containing protein n=1 Tax=Agarivorans sp. 1_MG-2023 TaxID=3062634 RepID=UPI0026E2B924|nr:DUF3291 domain-containing protein [Agarivorans sp. 1_MG-2023]MDO6766097.1 DUF3291 domain-containing protein [Agarivorans sp. 1_MG-2023]
MHLAQLNIATAKDELDSPRLKEFVDNLEPINALAEASEGFIWRLKDETGNATEIQAFSNPRIIVNMSVWQSVASLQAFMFKTHHVDFMRRRSEWFDKSPLATYVLWWVEPGHRPTIEEALARLEHLREHGESEHAFSFKSKVKAPATK